MRSAGGGGIRARIHGFLCDDEVTTTSSSTTSKLMSYLVILLCVGAGFYASVWMFPDSTTSASSDNAPLFTINLVAIYDNFFGCSAGWYLPEGEGGQWMECIMCDPGTYSLARKNFCVGCGAGSFLRETFQDERVEFSCEKCPAGTFSSTTDGVSCSGCPPNQVALYVGSSLCAPCPSGHEAADGGKKCVPSIRVSPQAAANDRPGGDMLTQTEGFIVKKIFGAKGGATEPACRGKVISLEHIPLSKCFQDPKLGPLWYKWSVKLPNKKIPTAVAAASKGYNGALSQFNTEFTDSSCTVLSARKPHMALVKKFNDGCDRANNVLYSFSKTPLSMAGGAAATAK